MKLASLCRTNPLIFQEGIRFENGKFVFDWNQDRPDDFIRLLSGEVIDDVSPNGHTIYCGFEFTPKEAAISDKQVMKRMADLSNRVADLPQPRSIIAFIKFLKTTPISQRYSFVNSAQTLNGKIRGYLERSKAWKNFLESNDPSMFYFEVRGEAPAQTEEELRIRAVDKVQGLLDSVQELRSDKTAAEQEYATELKRYGKLAGKLNTQLRRQSTTAGIDYSKLLTLAARNLQKHTGKKYEVILYPPSKKDAAQAIAATFAKVFGATVEAPFEKPDTYGPKGLNFDHDAYTADTGKTLGDEDYIVTPKWGGGVTYGELKADPSKFSTTSTFPALRPYFRNTLMFGVGESKNEVQDWVAERLLDKTALLVDDVNFTGSTIGNLLDIISEASAEMAEVDGYALIKAGSD